MKIVHRFYNDTFHRRLWVTFSRDVKLITERYDDIDVLDCDGFTDQIELGEGKTGVIIFIDADQQVDDFHETVVHESVHACEYMCKAVGMKFKNEQAAYLTEWVFRQVMTAFRDQLEWEDNTNGDAA